jgi:hypothetical protein
MASIDDLNAQVAVLTSQVNSLLTAVNVQKSYIDVASAIAVSGITGSSGSTLPAAGKSPVGNAIGLFSGAWIDPATLVVSSINGGPLPNGRFGGIGISGQLTTGRSGTFDSGSLASMASAADAGSVELSVGSTSGFETGISLTGNFATNYKGAIRFLTASKESARIDASGNFGIGTSAPTYKLQVASNGFPGLGLYRDVDVSSVGAAGQSFEIGARVGTTFVPGAAIIGQVDSPAGATGGLQFQVRNGNVLLEVARFDYNGGLLVGCKSTPNATNPGFGINVSDGNGDTAIVCSGGDVGGNRQIAFYNPNGMVGSVTTSGSSTNFLTSSDYRLKNSILPMTGALNKVALLKPCTYKWNADDSDGQGFIAHELAEVEAGCVTGEKDEVDAEGKPKYQGIDTSFLVATLTAAIQEQQAMIQAMASRITSLEHK